MIPARVSIVTIGTRDFAAMREFYAGIGWRDLYDGPDDFAMLDTGGAVLALWPHEQLAADANVPANPPADAFRGVALALNVDTREQVDAVIAELRAKGATITREPEDAAWGGRSAYFADPEGNAWEVAWNPNAVFDARGTMTLRGSTL